MKDKIKEYYRTKKGMIGKIYDNQKLTSKHRGHPMPSYTKKELREWMYSQSKFHELYDKWKASGYDRWLKPSCDRIDDYKPYTLDNLQLMTWQENKDKGHRDRRNGINNKYNVAVLQLTLDGEYITEYYSLREAERQTGISHASIYQNCRGIRKTAGGYVWKYKK